MTCFQECLLSFVHSPKQTVFPLSFSNSIGDDDVGLNILRCRADILGTSSIRINVESVHASVACVLYGVQRSSFCIHDFYFYFFIYFFFGGGSLLLLLLFPSTFLNSYDGNADFCIIIYLFFRRPLNRSLTHSLPAGRHIKSPAKVLPFAKNNQQTKKQQEDKYVKNKFI